jgi:hypothetical protein
MKNTMAMAMRPVCHHGHELDGLLQAGPGPLGLLLGLELLHGGGDVRFLVIVVGDDRLPPSLKRVARRLAPHHCRLAPLAIVGRHGEGTIVLARLKISHLSIFIGCGTGGVCLQAMAMVAGTTTACQAF